jgi:hypothetical protein
MLDLNFKRRSNEKRIAAEVMKEFMLAPPTNGYPNELLAHHFGLVCQRLNFVPDHASTGRVLAYALKEIAAHGRKVDVAIVAVEKASNALAAI